MYKYIYTYIFKNTQYTTITKKQYTTNIYPRVDEKLFFLYVLIVVFYMPRNEAPTPDSKPSTGVLSFHSIHNPTLFRRLPERKHCPLVVHNQKLTVPHLTWHIRYNQVNTYVNMYYVNINDTISGASFQSFLLLCFR